MHQVKTFLYSILVFMLTFSVTIISAYSIINNQNEIYSNATQLSDSISQIPITPAVISTPTTIPTIIPTTIAPVSAKLLFTGDVMLARSIETKILKGNDPFKYVKDIFDQYDYRVANLECAVTTKGIAALNKKYILKANPKTLTALNNANINSVSLANNHTMDYGSDGLLDMIQNLKLYSINNFGAGNNSNEAFSSLLENINGYKVAFLGFNDEETSYTASSDTKAGNASISKSSFEDKMISSIKTAKENSDIVISFMHWGKEYSQSPSLRQISLAHEIIDAGADLVIGSHPHVTQANEIYKDKNIVYSLGNFIFDGMQGEKNATDGNMLDVNILDKKIISIKLIPIHINPEGFPIPV